MRAIVLALLILTSPAYAGDAERHSWIFGGGLLLALFVLAYGLTKK